MRAKLLAIVVILGLAFGAGAWWFTRGTSAIPPPPAPEASQAIDPLCAQFIEQTLADATANPRSAPHRVKLAMVYQANGLPRLAAETYRQAISLQGDHADWWFHLARAEATLGSYQAAVEAAEHAAQLDPAHAPIHWNLGFWRLELADLDGARSAFGDAVSAAPQQPAGHIGLARIHLLNGQPGAALRLLEPFLTTLTDPAYVHQLMGTACRQLGRTSEAVEHLRLARGEAPIWDEPWTRQVATYRRGYIAMLQQADQMVASGRSDEALQILNKLRRQRPTDAVLLTKIGEVLMGRDQLEDAIDVLDEALTIDERYLAAHLHLSRIHRTRRHLTKALHHANRALAIQPTMGHAHLNKGLADFVAERWADAEISLASAVRYGVTDTQTLVNLGRARYQQRKLTEALQTYEVVLRREPEHFQTLLYAAVTNADLGNTQRAIRLLATANQLRPQDPALQEAARYVQQVGGG